MESVIDSFNERVQEIDLYFKMLLSLEQPDTQLFFPHRKRPHQYKRLDPDWLKTLKATAFLLIYNLIESSVREGIGAIYDQARQDGCTAATLEERIRKIWINQHFKKIESGNSVNSFREKGHELVELVLTMAVTDLDKELLPVSGNLDARKIRELCDKHGMTFSTHRLAHMGDKLVTIKDKRNSLAHGDESFAECGRQHTVTELIEIKNQAIRYIRGVLRNIKTYVNRGSYKTRP